MDYIVRRRPHEPFWSWYSEQELPGTPIALQTLRLRPDGDEVTTSHVGREQIREYLVNTAGFRADDPAEWPVSVTPVESPSASA